MTRHVSLFVTGILLQVAASAARASITAYGVPAGTVGNQAFNGALGMDFDVQNVGGITVDRIGVFDSGGDGLNLPINAAIYDRSTGLPVPGGALTFATGATGTLEGGSRFLTLGAPLFFPAGFQGSIVAEGYGATEPDGNQNVAPLGLTTNSAGAKIAFVGLSRWGNAGAFPVNADSGPNRFAAGSFGFDAIPGSIGTSWSALSRPSPVAGSQNFGGSLGIDFIVNGAGITLSSLGAFDSNGDGILSATGVTTQLWQRNTQGTLDPVDDTGTLITTEFFSAASPGILDGSYRFKDLASSLTLASGEYTIVAFGYDAAELNGNSGGLVPYTDDGNGGISFVGRSRFGTAGDFPVNPDFNTAQYMAGSFKFSAIPEPAMLSIAGILTVLLRRRCQRSGATARSCGTT